MNITCDSTSTTVLQVLEAVVKAENFVENFFLGLCALIGGDLVFLPHDLKIYKVKNGTRRLKEWYLICQILLFSPRLGGTTDMGKSIKTTKLR